MNAPKLFEYVIISIHAPREGCDERISRMLEDSLISIHAPREGCDPGVGKTTARPSDFNPRTP